MIDAICRELKMQKDYLGGEAIETIYLGGGTPSLLTERHLERLFTAIENSYRIVRDPEITIEANPDDLNIDKLRMFFKAGINRLSIGIQSFHEDVLRFLNRAHNSEQALRCLTDARTAGFEKISIDLIYAIPSEGHQNWHEDLTQALELRPEHISSYCLTIEPKTTFGSWLKKGTYHPVEDDFAAIQFEILNERLTSAGYEQYEVSNFCLPGLYSRHNSGYWRQEKYLGVGPSAHSYDGVDRRYNISHNQKYMKAINSGAVPFTADLLNDADKVNEYLLTTLRTKWGAELRKLRAMNYDLENNKAYLDTLIKEKYAVIEHDHLRLTQKGMLLADKISSDLFLV